IVAVTGARPDQAYGFTFSDLTQRLLPGIVLDAYPTSAVRPERAVEVASAMIATPPFQEGRAS
ncbi:MAG: ATPase, partial [Usitatibacteraceae bacterium]